MSENVLVALAGILVAGAAAQWLAWRLRLPAILLLLATGLLAGPALGWLRPDDLFGDLFFPGISLGVAVILFEGGLGLRFRELKGVQQALYRLLSVGTVITGAGAAIAAHLLLNLSWGVAFVLGAVLTVTGPTVVGPLLRDIRLTGRVAALLRWEGIVIDPIGALLTATVVLVIRSKSRDFPALHLIGDLAVVVVVGVGLGLAAAWALVLVFRRYWAPDRMHSPITLAVVIGVFTLADWLHADAGLVAVTVMGIAMANQRKVAVKHVLEFKETLIVILLSALFVILGARVEPDQMLELGGRGLLFVGVLVLVIRPLSVFAATAGTGLSWAERTFVAGLAPRGVVATAMASVFAIELARVGVPGAERLLPATVLTVVGTVLVYGLTANWLARRLGLVHPNPQGLLIAGASGWVRRLAKAVTDAGGTAALVDTDWGNVSAARMLGLQAVYGSILSEQVYDEMDTSRLRRFIAATPNDELNALACQRFAEFFGKQEVYHLPAGRESGRLVTVAPEQRGREWLGRGQTFAEIDRAYGPSGEIRSTRLTAEFGYGEWARRYENSGLPLVIIRKDGSVIPTTVDGLKPQAGDTIIALYAERRPPSREENGPAAGQESTGLAD